MKESENEESPEEEDQYWKRETRATSNAMQLKIRVLSQEKERPQQSQPKPLTSHTNAASN